MEETGFYNFKENNFNYNFSIYLNIFRKFVDLFENVVLYKMKETERSLKSFEQILSVYGNSSNKLHSEEKKITFSIHLLRILVLQSKSVQEMPRSCFGQCEFWTLLFLWLLLNLQIALFITCFATSGFVLHLNSWI